MHTWIEFMDLCKRKRQTWHSITSAINTPIENIYVWAIENKVPDDAYDKIGQTPSESK